KWSIAEVAEHIAAAESLIRGVASKAMEAPATEELLKGAVKDEMILTMIPNRSQKFKAPEPLVPINRFATPAATIAEYKKQRAEAIKLAGGDTDFRKYAAPHPAFGPLDAYGWLLFLSAHSERHTLQIEEVKASEGFPKE
ncbi:MAG TPA: DinB family protein, partial [Thermoanaerobaculia bacterium]